MLAAGAPAQTFSGYVSSRGTDAIRLKAFSIIGYTSVSGILQDSDSFDTPPILNVGDVGESYNIGLTNRVTPVSLIEKDYGSVAIDYTYTNGGPLASDSIRLRLDVHGSAEGALVGDPLKAASLTIFVGLSYVLLGDPDGGLIGLTLPALPSLTNPSMETLQAQLSGGTNSPVVMNPGDTARTLTLSGSQNWTYELSYSMTVPFGTDPDFSLDLSGGEIGFDPVPEPGVGALLALGAASLGGAGLRRRLRRKAGTGW